MSEVENESVHDMTDAIHLKEGEKEGDDWISIEYEDESCFDYHLGVEIKKFMGDVDCEVDDERFLLGPLDDNQKSQAVNFIEGWLARSIY